MHSDKEQTPDDCGCAFFLSPSPEWEGLGEGFLIEMKRLEAQAPPPYPPPQWEREIKTHSAHLFAVARIVLVSTLVTSNAFAADLASPKSAFLAYTDAIAAGDFDALKGMVLADDAHLKLLKDQIAYAAIERKFAEVANKAFPATPTTKPADATERIRASIATAEVRIVDDTATLTTPQTPRPIRFKKVAGDWKIDVGAMFPSEFMEEVIYFRKALGDVMEAMTTEIAAGKYKTYDDAKKDMETRVKMRLSTPSDMGSTQPSL